MIASNRRFSAVGSTLNVAADARFRFVSADEFSHLSVQQLNSETPEVLYQKSDTAPDIGRQGMPSGTKLLTPAGERHLFRKMNFLKYRAATLAKGRRNSASQKEIESLLSESAETRAAIVNANLGLVAAVARKFARQDPEDLIGEGHVILLAAVEKFNYSKGFRFSTYATHALHRHFFRVLQRQQKRRRRESSVSTEYLADHSQHMSEDLALNPRLAAFFVNHLDDCLSAREQTILCERFGLKGRSPTTLRAVADGLQLSKERVRQLQIGALEKLQDLAVRCGLRLDSSEIPLSVEVA